MITGAAFCPGPPLLVPAVAQGAAPELDELRSACRAAIRRIAGPGVRWIVLGSGPVTARYEPTVRGSFAGFGVPLEISLGSDEPGPVELPLSLTIGAWLLRDALGPSNGAVGYAVGPYSADRPDLFEWAADLETEVALLVVGDGSARRSTVAPGYFDERAEAFDAGVAAALRSGDAELLHLDVGLGDELLASGPPVWGEAANALEGSEFDDAELLYEDAPYGVGYFVAAWTNK